MTTYLAMNKVNKDIKILFFLALNEIIHNDCAKYPHD